MGEIVELVTVCFKVWFQQLLGETEENREKLSQENRSAYSG
jgi:hypothetical protein